MVSDHQVRRYVFVIVVGSCVSFADVRFISALAYVVLRGVYAIWFTLVSAHSAVLLTYWRS